MTTDITLRVAVRDADQAIAKLKQFGTSGEKALQALSRQAKQSASPLNAVRKNIGGISLQLQDVGVQLQSGTSPFTIIAQQGTQVASLFGPGGAVAGALLAFGALGASSLLSFTSQAGEATEKVDELSKAVERLKKSVVGQASKPADILAAGDALGDGGQQLIERQFERLKQEALKRAEEARQNSLDVFSDFENSATSFLRFSGTREQTDELKQRIEDYEGLLSVIERARSSGNLIGFANELSELAQRAEALGGNFEAGSKQIDEAALKIGQELAIVTENAQKLADAQKLLNEGPPASDNPPPSSPGTTQRQISASQRVIASLERELLAQEGLAAAMLAGTEAVEAWTLEREIQSRLSAAGTEATAQEREEIKKLVVALDDEKRARKDSNRILSERQRLIDEAKILETLPSQATPCDQLSAEEQRRLAAEIKAMIA